MTYRTALIPVRHSAHAAHGPVTTARRRRFFLGYVVLFLLGVAVSWCANSPGGVAAGLGLVMPGAGFLAHAVGEPMQVAMHLGMALASAGLFAAMLGLWFGSGNVVMPAVVWVGSLVWSASMDHGHQAPWARILVPSFVVAGGLAFFVTGRVRLRRALIRGEQRNQYLAQTRGLETPQASADVSVGTSMGEVPHVEALSDEDLEAMRFLLDRALQPVEEFNGYSFIEQFQTASIRYQLMMTSYVLSLTQFSRCPSFHGYMSTAQRNLIEKTKLPQVWSYWKWENAFGNLRLGADPMAPATHDNVMYSGWFAAMVGMYASNTGDRRYDGPGSITLNGPLGRQYVYDWPKVVDILADNFSRSAYTLFPCEPNWIYPLCNTYAGIGLRIHDRLRGTDHWRSIADRYRTGLEDEFVEPDGRMVVIRSSHTGLSVPGLKSVMTEAGVALFQHGVLPDVARRTWEILRHDMLKMIQGRLDVRYYGTDFLDVGNYHLSRGGTLAGVSSLAAEMGDQEVAVAARALIDEKYPAVTEHGIRRHPGLSVNTHLLAFAGRAGRTNGLHDLVTHGTPEAFLRGPLLVDASYPEVLVAKAASDGRALDLVLAPGRGGGRQKLGLSQLVAGARYRCTGAVQREMRADNQGRAALEVDLNAGSEGRRSVRIVPVI